MKNPLLDAIRQMKAKRVAIVVGDADEMGLPDMVQNMGDDGEEMPEAEEPMDEEMDEVAEEGDADPDLEDGEEYAESEDGDSDDIASDDEAAESVTDAEKVMGRRPFEKKRAPASQEAGSSAEIPDDVAKELIDEKSLDRMKASGRRPNGLFQRAQAGLAERLKRK